MDVQAHWERIYSQKAADEVSYRPHLETSLALIAQAASSPSASIIDVGGGESTLVDDPLARPMRTSRSSTFRKPPSMRTGNDWARPGTPRPSKPIYRRENGLRPGPYTDIIREVHPPDRAGRIDEELSGPRDVVTSFAALCMQHSVLPNGLSLGIGEKWKRVAPGLAELLTRRANPR
jgi:hypothetical protein